MSSRDYDQLLFDVGGNLVTTGSANAYAVDTSQAVNGYSAGLWLRMKANHTNTGASTLAVKQVPSAPIRKNVNDALVGGEIIAGKYFDVVYEATNGIFQLQTNENAATVGGLPLTSSGNRWGIIASVNQSDGGMEAGQFIDFHNTDADVTDYAVRLRSIGLTDRLQVETSSPASLRDIDVTATDAEIRAATAGNFGVIASALASAAAAVALTDAATVAVDWNAAINFTLTVVANRIIGNPTNGQPGTWRTIRVQGNDATLRSITFAAQFLGELPIVTDATSTKWYEFYVRCITASHFSVSAKRVLG